MNEFNVFESVEYTSKPTSIPVDKSENYFDRAVVCFGNGRTQALDSGTMGTIAYKFKMLVIS